MTQMNHEQIVLSRLIELEKQVAVLTDRVNRIGTYNPVPMPAPVYGPIVPPNQWPPYGPPYTITCKMEDGTTKEMKLDSPPVAYATNKTD